MAPCRKEQPTPGLPARFWRKALRTMAVSLQLKRSQLSQRNFVLDQKKQSTREFRQQTVEKRSAIYAAALGLTCAVGTAFLTKESQADFYFAVITALITYIFFEQVARRNQLLELKERLLLLEQTGEKTLSHNGSFLEIAEKLASLQQCDSVIQKTGYAALRHAVSDVDITKEGDISIKGRESAFLAYTHFWEQIARTTRNLDGARFGAYITHTSDVEKWYDTQSNDMRVAQEVYARNISVFRIFVNRKPTEVTHLLKYLEVMGSMEKEGIFCVYAHLSQLEPLLDKDCLDTDFCIVDGGTYTSEWTLSPSGRVSGFFMTGSEHAFEKNRRSWVAILRVLETIHYESSSVPPEHSVRLREFRRNFFYAYDQLARRKGFRAPSQAQLNLAGDA
jgi:hypothetical protein